MAFLSQLDDENAIPTSTVPLASSGTSSVIGSGNPQHTKPTQSGSFTNLNDYLRANMGNLGAFDTAGQKSINDITGQIQGNVNDAANQQNYSTTWNGNPANIRNESQDITPQQKRKMAEDIYNDNEAHNLGNSKTVDQMLADPTSPENHTKNVRTLQEYTGTSTPGTNYQDTTGYSQAQGNISNLGNLSTQLNDPSGSRAFLDNLFKGNTSGQGDLNNALFNMSGSHQNLNNYLTNAQNNAQNNLGQLNNNSRTEKREEWTPWGMQLSYQDANANNNPDVTSYFNPAAFNK